MCSDQKHVVVPQSDQPGESKCMLGVMILATLGDGPFSMIACAMYKRLLPRLQVKTPAVLPEAALPAPEHVDNQ